MYPKPIQKLIDLFTKFPTVGPRTAARFVFHLLKAEKEDVEELTKSIQNLKSEIKICAFCFKPFLPSEALAKEGVGQGKLCEICSNRKREKTKICIIEKEIDLNSIEKTKKYKGLYFILGGTVSKFKKEDIKKLRVDELIERIKNPQKFGIEISKFEEIILAINPTTEGEATILYLQRKLKPLGIKITRLGRGLPVGGELEYADEQTLGSAFEGRK